jgi:hypothetical protein
MSDLQKALDAINLALGVVKTVASTPGINLLPYASTIAAAVGAMQTAVAAGVSIMPYVTAITDTFSGSAPPTEQELAALDAKIAELEAKVQAPLPPKEDGEPE